MFLTDETVKFTVFGRLTRSTSLKEWKFESVFMDFENLLVKFDVSFEALLIWMCCTISVWQVSFRVTCRAS